MAARSGAHSQLVNWCLGWAEAKHRQTVSLWKNNSGAIKINADGAGKQRFIRFGATGTSDIIGFTVRTGKFVALEIKTGKGKLTIPQTVFRDQLTRAGGYFCEVRSYHDAINFLQNVHDHELDARQ